MAGPHEMMFQNQLQFNLNVPLTTYNMATHFHKPRPLTIERAVAASSCQGFPMAQLAGKQAAASHAGKSPTTAAVTSGFQFSALSQDKMATAVQLAQRDLKNQKLQQKAQQVNSSASQRRRSPSPETRRHEKPVHGARYWEHQRSRMPKKSKNALSAKSSRAGVKEHDRNRAPLSVGSQTPPPSPHKQVFLNTKLVTDQERSERSDSPPTRDTPSLTRVARVPANDIEKLQQEMELCLQQIESVQKRALSEHNTDFLRPAQPRFHRDTSYLEEEEGEDRRQMRASEQTHRALRTIYNLQQQVKEMERHLAKLPPDSKATKKSQASQRLMAVNKGAVRLLQTFVNQLPQQDLRGGLPSHFSDLTELVRQVTLLSANASVDGVKSKNVKKPLSLSPVQKDLIAMVDQVEKLHQDWQQEACSQAPAPKASRQKPAFITNFTTAADGDGNRQKKAFTKEQVDKPQLFNTPGQDAWYNERKAMLQAGIRTLLNAGRPRKRPPKKGLSSHPYSKQMTQPPAPKGFSLKVPTRKPPPARKGYLLSYKDQKCRPMPQMITHFADPTITANLKASTMLHNPITTTQSISEPPSPREKKRVNFATGSQGGAAHYHASYPGARAKRRSRSSSPRSRRSPARYRGWSPASLYRSDSDPSLMPSSARSEDESSSPSLASGLDSPGSATRGRHRSLSPVVRGQRSPGRQPRRMRAMSPTGGKRRQFFLADADPQLVDELFPEDRASQQSYEDSQSPRSVSFSPRREQTSMEPYAHKVEKRIQQKLANSRLHGDGVHSVEEQCDRLAEAMVDEAVSEVTEELTGMERRRAAGEQAAAYIDSATCHNILQALDRMEKENDRLRQKYSKVTFHDSVPKRRLQSAAQVFAEFRSERPRAPPAFEVTNIRPVPQDIPGVPRAFSEELSQEPIIFTKDSNAYRSHIRFQERGQGAGSEAAGPLLPPPAAPQKQPSAVRPKTLLSMKQTVVEHITDAVERFEYYQRGLKQHLGKKNPFQVYESVADDILKMCCDEVTRELENINADMAENIYTSEFLDENGQPLAPPELAADFETGGTAAQNLRDSAAAQRSVEAAVSRTVGSLMLPPEEEEFSIVSPKRVVEVDEDASARWDSSMKHVYDATALYEASVTEQLPADGSVQKRLAAGKAAARDDDTRLEEEEDEYDYDDDYTDVSDDEEDETGSPSP